MGEKTLKFDNIRVNKKEFHKSKQPISLDLINIDQIVVSDKFNIVMLVSSILLVAKRVRLLNRYILSYLKKMHT